MKKQYIIPSQEIVELKMSQYLLAGSELDKNTDPIDGGGALSPDFGPELPGMPGIPGVPDFEF